MEAISFVQSYFDFKPLNPALSFPEDLLTIPTCVALWGILHFVLSRSVFVVIEKKLYNFKNEVDRLKYKTAVWKFVYYAINCFLGLAIAYTERSWVFTPSLYFVDWPNQPMSNAIKYYYVMQMAGYVYAVLLMPFEAKQTKADYLAYLVHHSSTLFLLWVSYIYSFHRIGTVIAFLHDLADPWMEIAKLTLYTGNNKVADVLFAVFMVTFLITRNFIFPYYVISSIPLYCRYPDGTMLPSNGMNYALQLGLWTLEALHVYWAFLILKMAYKAVVKGEVEDDIRDVVDAEIEKKKQ